MSGWVLGLALALAFPAPAAAQDRAPEAERLTGIREELRSKKRDLEKFQMEAERLRKALGEQEARIRKARERRSKWVALGRRAERDRRRLQGSLDTLESEARRGLERAASAADLAYVESVLLVPLFRSADLWRSEALRSRLSAQIGGWRDAQGRLEAVSGEAEAALRRAGELSLKARRERGEEEAVRRTLELGRAELQEAQTRVARTRGELAELEAAAQEMNEMVARLTTQGDGADPDPPTSQGLRVFRPASARPLKPHSLPWPAQGRVLTRFGKARVPSLGTWVLHRGIRIATEPSAPVRSVRPGRVGYAGRFRGYGQVVIVDHGEGLVSVYGNLGRILKRHGQPVGAGEAVGEAGGEEGAPSLLAKAPEGRGSVYFEIRRGPAAVDPLPWLRKH